jgi:hypothetical protein
MDDRILKKSQYLIEKFGTRDPFEIAHMLGYNVKFINTKKTTVLNSNAIMIG